MMDDTSLRGFPYPLEKKCETNWVPRLAEALVAGITQWS